MTTVGFMSAKMPSTFAVDDEVATRLLEKAMQTESPSKYVNRLLKWALDNYKEEHEIRIV